MALTNRFVTDAGAGLGTGVDLANAMSYATFLDYMVTGGSQTAAPGDVFLLCGTSQSRTTNTDTWVNGGNATSPVVVRGCDSSGNPAYAGRTNDNGPLITTNFPVITYTTGALVVSGGFIIIEGLNISSANTVRTLDLTGNNNVVLRCKVVNSGTNANSCPLQGTGTNSMLFDNDASFTGASNGNSGLRVNGANAKAFCNRVTGGVTVGILCSSTTIIVNNLVYDSTVGISMNATSGTPFIFGNTLVDCTDGVDIITGTTALQCIVNNMITDNSGNGIDMVSASNAALIAYTRFRDNGTNINSGTDWAAATNYNPVTTDTGGQSTDYVNAAGGDYSLIAASPATSAGIPQLASMGAFQRDQTAAPAGGASSYTFG